MSPAVARSPGTRRGIVALAVAVGATLAGGSLADAAHAAAPARQALVVLLHDRDARTAPSVRAATIERVRARRPLTGVRTLLPVLARATSPDGRTWLQVRLPGRPNGHQGWIPAARTRAAATDWRLLVTLSSRRVTVWHQGRVVRRFAAIVGAPSTPTPRGRFFVEEAVALHSGSAGAPYALASSARSNVLQEFDGGPGQIALHGTAHLAGALGTAASHGCIRLSARAITWLARRVGGGTPLTIVA
jgi:lipoprotein-anchoring transpeptidase ErfK/SrfK